MWSVRKLYPKQRGLSIITLDVGDEAVVYQAAWPQHRIGCGRCKQRGLSIITLDVVDEAIVYQATRPQHHRIDVVDEEVVYQAARPQHHHIGCGR